MSTLLLDRSSWDLVVDSSGNIAVADDPYATAQDAASAMSLFRNELYYDTAKGVPYWQQILGHFPPVPVMKAAFEQAALSVPGVVSATVYLAAVQGRRLTGQVQITTADGQTATVGIVPLASEATGIPFRLNTSLLNSGVLLE